MISAPKRDDRMLATLARLQHNKDFQTLVDDWLRPAANANINALHRESDATVIGWRQGTAQTLETILDICESPRNT